MSTKPPKHVEIKTHCPNGHEYDDVGFYVVTSDTRGEYRRCKRCHADRAKAHRAKKKVEALQEELKKRVPRGKVPKALPDDYRGLTAADRASFRVLEEEVGEHLEVVLWNIADVKRLSSGLPKDGDAIHIFSDEWLDRRNQCVGFIRAHAGLFERKVGARSCEVREVEKAEAVSFLKAFHIQGANRLGIIYFGLYHRDELLGLMSLGRHSRQIAENRIVMDRLCFRVGVQVVGGPSKMMKVAARWAKEQPYDEVVTFSDSRWTDGALYGRMGFELERRLKPDYSYTRRGWRFSKQSQRKNTTGCPEGMTELEWATCRGLTRVYDAGKKRWVLNLWPGVHRTRNEKSSERCAKQHRDGEFKHSHIRGYFRSKKNCGSVYYASSYELRCLFLLEEDSSVLSFRRCDAFQGDEGWRNPDLWVDFSDGRSEVWEVKPEGMLLNDAVQEQIRESEVFAESKGVGFRLWTENDSGLGSDHEIVKWAQEYLVSVGQHEWSDRKREAQRKKRKRYYAKVKVDKVEVWCDFCQETHTPLRLTYEKNIKRNGKYICERYGGHLSGKKPKDHLKKTNPYAKDGKKQCSTCGEIRPIEDFQKNRGTYDGKNPRCKECCKAKRRAAKGA